MRTLRPLSPKEVALDGLERNQSIDGLKVVPVRGKGQGLITTLPISKGKYVTEYKYKHIYHTKKEKDCAVEDLKKNKEGSYILEIYINGTRPIWRPLGTTIHLEGK